jgi:hypothetical protein
MPTGYTAAMPGNHSGGRLILIVSYGESYSSPPLSNVAVEGKRNAHRKPRYGFRLGVRCPGK